MTVTVYLASFADADGKKIHGSIFWDKYTPKKLKATLCPHITASEIDYPIWSADASYGRSGLDILIHDLKKEATKQQLTLLSEEETKFTVRQTA